MGVTFFLEARILVFQRLKLRLKLSDLPLQFFLGHGVVSLGCGREVHRYGLRAVLKFHRL